MTDDQRKMLTEFLDEDYYDSKFPHWGEHTNRTFTTWQDIGDVKEKLVEKKLWWKFIHYFDDKPPYCNTDSVYQDDESSFWDWLFRPTVDGKSHFCRLVAEFLGERKC